MNSIKTFLSLLIVTVSSSVVAGDGIRIYGGIGISSGNLRIYITDDYSDRHYQPPHRIIRYQKHNHGHHYGHRSSVRKSYGYSRFGDHPHWRHRNHYPVYPRIIIRDPGHYDYRKYRHQRSYNYR